MPLHYFEFKEASNQEDLFITSHLKSVIKGKKTLIVYFDLMRGYKKHQLPENFAKKVLLVEDSQALNCLAVAWQLIKFHKEHPIKAIFLERLEFLSDDPNSDDPSVLRNVALMHTRAELLKTLESLKVPVYLTGVSKKDPSDQEGPRVSALRGREYSLMTTVTADLDGSKDLAALLKEMGC